MEGWAVGLSLAADDGPNRSSKIMQKDTQRGWAINKLCNTKQKQQIRKPIPSNVHLELWIFWHGTGCLPKLDPMKLPPTRTVKVQRSTPPAW